MTAAPLHDLRPKILVVDADVDSHLLYTDALGFDEREITYAVDGRDALVKALAYPFALVITESRLPYIDGYALCEILRRDSATRTTPIIVVTTDSRPASVQRARQAGADAVLVKPFLSDVLCADAQRLMLDSDERQAPTGRARLKLAAQRDRSTSLVALGSGEPKPRRNSRAHKRYTTTRPPMARRQCGARRAIDRSTTSRARSAESAPSSPSNGTTIHAPPGAAVFSIALARENCGWSNLS